jgi:hypothetical protein
MAAADSGPDPADHADALLYPSARAVERFERTMTLVGIALKTLILVGLFVWAAHSETGAAALQGVVAAEVFTWIVFRFLNWQFRGFQFQVGAAYEALLLIIFWNRGALFEMHHEAESIAAAAGFFMVVLVVKAIAWGAEHAVTTSGVKEPASP